MDDESCPQPLKVAFQHPSHHQHHLSGGAARPELAPTLSLTSLDAHLALATAKDSVRVGYRERNEPRLPHAKFTVGEELDERVFPAFRGWTIASRVEEDDRYVVRVPAEDVHYPSPHQTILPSELAKRKPAERAPTPALVLATEQRPRTLQRARSAHSLKQKAALSPPSTKRPKRPSTANSVTPPSSSLSVTPSRGYDPSETGIGPAREFGKMVKERRSLQSLFVPSFSFLHSPPTSALPTPASTSSPAPNALAPAPAASGAMGKRRSFVRARAQTYTGGSASTSASSAATYVSSPPSRVQGAAADEPHVRRPRRGTEGEFGTWAGLSGGRESPSAYLLDDDPFAATTSPSRTSEGQSASQLAFTTSLGSPGPLSASSVASSSASLSSMSMPVTPTAHMFELPLVPPLNFTSSTRDNELAERMDAPLPAPPPPSPLNHYYSHANITASIASTSTAAPPRTRVSRSTSDTSSLAPYASSPSASRSPSRPPPPPPLLTHSHSYAYGYPQTAPTSPPLPPLPPPSPHSQQPLPPSLNLALNNAAGLNSAPPPAAQAQGSSRARPAHTRPAFAPRPSLPSLSTLARMDLPTSSLVGMLGLSARMKKRKGKVGAGLPLDPWDDPALMMPSPQAIARERSDAPEPGEISATVAADVEDETQPRRAFEVSALNQDGQREPDHSDSRLENAEEDDRSTPTPLASQAAQVTCDKGLADVPFTPERDSFLSLRASPPSPTKSLPSVDVLPAASKLLNSRAPILPISEVAISGTLSANPVISMPANNQRAGTSLHGYEQRVSVESEGVDTQISHKDDHTDEVDSDETLNMRSQLAATDRKLSAPHNGVEAAAVPNVSVSAVDSDAGIVQSEARALELSGERVLEDEGGDSMPGSRKSARVDIDSSSASKKNRPAALNLRSATSLPSITIPTGASIGRITPVSDRAPSPLPSPLGSLEDFAGVVLSASPNYSVLAQQGQIRPDSLALDPGLPAATRTRSIVVEDDDTELLPASEAASNAEVTNQPTNQFDEEEDSSMLPPLSTLPEDDPVFSFSPSRTHSSNISRKSSWSSRSHSRSHSRNGYSSGEYPASLPSLQSDLRRQGSESSAGSGSSGDIEDEFSSGSYVGESRISAAAVADAPVIHKLDDADFVEGTLAPRSSHADSFYDDNCDIPMDFNELVGWRPFDSSLAGFEPGSSASTLRASQGLGSRRRSASEGYTAEDWATGRSSRQGVTAPINMLAHSHSGGYSGTRGGNGSGRERGGGNGYEYQRAYNGFNNSSGSDFGGRGVSGGNGGGRDDGGDEDGRRNRKPSVTDPSTSTSDSESESEDDYRKEQSPIVPITPSAPLDTFSQRRNGRKGVFKPLALSEVPPVPVDSRQDSASTTDDDVPLAQRLPGALQAQKTIRRQVRDEREQRRRERVEKVEVSASRPRTRDGTVPSPLQVPERGRPMMLRPPQSAGPAPGAGVLSSTQEAAFMAQRSQEIVTRAPTRRARARTIGEASGVAPDDLMRRLLRVQAQNDVDNARLMPDTLPAYKQSRPSGELRSPDRLSPTSHGFPPIDRVPGPSNLSTRTQQGPPSPRSAVFPQTAPIVEPQHDSGRSLRPMRSFHGRSSRGEVSPTPPIPVARRPTSSKGRPSHEAYAEEHVRNKLVKSARSSLENGRSSKSTRTSADESFQHPPVPPLPDARTISSMSPTSPIRSAFLTASQMRIFIGDLQRFNVVEVSPETNAKDVLDVLEQQGDLRGEDRRSSGFMLLEMCQDYGIERPIRSFELLADIQASWNKDKTANVFMVKRTPLAFSLATIPTSIPKRTGFVDYESRKGKWSKRWLELREQGLWLSKREGKEDEFLCSLSAFDVYTVNRILKSSKSFCFALKSTEPISLFENKADYLHVFSVPEETGRQWVESIMLARSYILFQEKHVLFRNKNPTSTGQSSSGSMLSRSGTRKRPAQTLVSVAAPFNLPVPTQTTFEPGSLLAKHSAGGA